MNEPQNTFEDAMDAVGSMNPFEDSSPPSINLGSEENTENPFATPEQSQPNEIAALKNTAALTEETADKSNAQVSLFPRAESADKAAESPQPITQIPAFAKLPVFEHGAVKEEIQDITQTFEDLRLAKMDDFPELEDSNRVSWDVIYGKTRKSVSGSEAKKTKIGEFKASIEASKSFTDELKKSKEKSPVCIIKPRVTAQSKGEHLPTYKGVFASLADAEASGKVISIVPGRDGKVYEIRNEEMGRFITPTQHCPELSEIKAGFTPVLPLIPHYELCRIIAFFRSLIQGGKWYEAIANIYWDREQQEFCVDIPQQYITPGSVDADVDVFSEYPPERFLHYMDIHSHNYMPARFSAQDNRDEKATRLYAVIGKLNEFIPQLNVRISNGGKYLPIDPAIVFENFGDYYPEEWLERLTLAGDKV